MTHPARRDTPATVPPMFGISAASVLLVMLAAVSALLLADFSASSVTMSAPLTPSFARESWFYWVGPEILVIAIVSAGFPRIGDIVAVVVACGMAIVCTLLTMFTLDMRLGAVVVMQVGMFIAALVDLSLRRNVARAAIPTWVRLAGLVVPIVIGDIGYNIINAPFSKETARRATLSPQARASEMGWVLEPSPLLPDSIRLARTDWADYSVAGRLTGFAACIERFRGDSGGPYPRSLRQLHDWSVKDTVSSLGCASKLTRSTRDTSLMFLTPSDARVIRYTPPAGPIDPFRPAPFVLETEAIWDSAKSPNVKGSPGVRNYMLDSAGRFHVTDKHRRVTTRDPVLPTCNPPETFVEIAECGVVYPARKRWGAVGLPFATISMSHRITIGDGFSPMLSFHPTTALDSIARVTIDWDDNGGSAVEALPIASQRSYGAHDWNRFASHVYRTPGPRQVTLTVTTRSGGVYKGSDSVVVTP